jgi:hypothetical protein
LLRFINIHILKKKTRKKKQQKTKRKESNYLMLLRHGPTNPSVVLVVCGWPVGADHVGE